MTPVVERSYPKKSKPLKKTSTDPIWTEIFRMVGDDEKDMDKIIDWISDEGLDRLYWLAPNITWKRKLSEETERRKLLKEMDDHGES